MPLRKRLVLELWVPLLAIMAGIAAWYHVLRLRERVTAHARRLCERHGLQLLDDSVALHRLHLRWHKGPKGVVREYRFETSTGGNDRQIASITLLGERIVRVSVPERENHAASMVVPASPYAATLPRPDSHPGSGGNVVPIGRARRTLH